MVGNELFLRDVQESDLPVFYENQLDEEANRMVAVASGGDSDFAQHWRKVLADNSVKIQTIIHAGEIAGYVVAFDRAGEREIGYWIGKRYWGKGITTRAVAAFLRYETARPLSAHVAKHNVASMRVLEKSGFRVLSEEPES